MVAKMSKSIVILTSSHKLHYQPIIQIFDLGNIIHYIIKYLKQKNLLNV